MTHTKKLHYQIIDFSGVDNLVMQGYIYVIVKSLLQKEAVVMGPITTGFITGDDSIKNIKIMKPCGGLASHH
jgi:hypothetical protein